MWFIAGWSWLGAMFATEIRRKDLGTDMKPAYQVERRAALLPSGFQTTSTNPAPRQHCIAGIQIEDAEKDTTSKIASAPSNTSNFLVLLLDLDSALFGLN